MIKKAMILAAGLGTRLKPLTLHRPKPLVPILNKPLLEYHLEQLAELEVQDVAINVHHLPEQIQYHLGHGERWGLNITYSLESPTILGTGEGIARLHDFFAKEPMFLVINGDIFHQVDLRSALHHHAQSGAVATLLTRTHPGDSHVGSVDIDDAGWIKRVPDMPQQNTLYKRMYTGMQVLTPRIFEYLTHLPPPPSCILRTAYRRMLENHLPVASHDIGQTLWKDIGDPSSYLDTQITLLDQRPTPQQIWPDHVKIHPPVCLGEQIQWGSDVEIGPYVVVGDRCTIGSQSRLSHSIVWPDTQLPAHSNTHHAIAWPNEILTIPPTQVES